MQDVDVILSKATFGGEIELLRLNLGMTRRVEHGYQKAQPVSWALKLYH